ncbi:MAG: sugar ABC transporter permease [Elusimicrobia bacterium RIFOXYA2_FULL_39_19]|nr:MAG: sugar ABC transporter permease [Elusimicrobia bacterium RIFOXYA2_FULL_39_19]
MKEEKIQSILILLGSFFMVGFCLLPFIYMLVTSFSSSPDYLSSKVSFGFTFNNYRSVLGTDSLHFMQYLRNSLLISAISAFFCVFIASLGAYSITRLNLPHKMGFLFFILAISMFPQVCLISYLFKLMTSLGWINTYFALILPYIAWILPLCLWILASYFAQIPAELDKAALIDGCTPWQVLYKIILPVSRPGIFSTALLAFIFAFNEFLFSLILTSDHNARTIPVGIALFQGLHGEIPWGNIMAASIIAVIPILLIIIMFQKNIIQGLTRGAVKG